MRISLIVLVFLSLICSSAFSAPTNKKLQIGMTQEFDSLNPILTSMVASFYILRMVNRGLFTFDSKGDKIPHLVEKVPDVENGLAEIIEVNGVKKVKAIWKIRDNAVWGDGHPVTCLDFQFAVDVARSDKVSVPNMEQFNEVEKIEIPDKAKKKCVVTYKRARWDFNRVSQLFFIPKHLEEKVFKKHGDKVRGYENNSLYVTDPTNPGLYNGPYLIKEVKLGSHVVIEKNPRYFGEKAKIEQIVLRLIPNTATLEANLLSQTVDMISVLGFEFDQAVKFADKVEKKKLPYEVNFRPGMIYEHIDLNNENEFLKDIRVRRALMYATPREELTKVVFSGKIQPATHYVMPLDSWYTENGVKKYPASLRKAKKLFKEAGFVKKPDGYLYKDDKKFQVTMMTTAGRKLRELVQQFLKGHWKKVGVDVVIRNYPARVFFGEYVRRAKYEHMAMYAFVNEPGYIPRNTLHSQSIPTKENSFNGANRVRFKNAEMDQLIEQMEVEFSSEKRKQLSHRMQQIYSEQLPALPLFYRSDVSVTPKNLKGYVMKDNLVSPANFVEYWSLDTKKAN